MTLVKISTVVSDLFFMVDNSNYFKALECSPDDAPNILLESATSFCYLIGQLGEEYTPEDIIDDFLGRV